MRTTPYSGSSHTAGTSRSPGWAPITVTGRAPTRATWLTSSRMPRDRHSARRSSARHFAVRPPDPDAIADHELDFPLPFDHLLDALALRQLEEHALLAPGHAALPVGVVQGEILINDEVADPDVRDAGDEGLDRGPCILGHRLRGARADHGEDERQDEGEPHGCGYNA